MSYLNFNLFFVFVLSNFYFDFKDQSMKFMVF
jgi:hypothetical protein